MSKLIKKVEWKFDGSNTEMYMYGEADFEANKAMQEPLEKLYQYENQSNMREKVVEYISELEMEIKRCENELQKYYKNGYIGVINMQSRISALQEVINDLKDRLEKRV